MASKIYDPWGKKSRTLNKATNRFIRMSAKATTSRKNATQGCMVIVLLFSASVFSIFLLLIKIT